jgi:hypothetical protein
MRVRIWNDEDAMRTIARDPAMDAPPVPEPAARVSQHVEREPQGDVDSASIAALRDRLRADGWTPRALVAAACELTGAAPESVRLGGRRAAVSRARAIAAYVACDGLAWPAGELAPMLGVLPSSLAAAGTRGRAMLAATGHRVADVLRRAGVDC